MRYLSVCSGIEAATAAWHPLGWTPLAFAEIDPFARAVLQHHYPDVPLHGDFTALRHEPWIVDADVMVGGTPCQAFSVAGLRRSLEDARGNLTLEFLRLADAIDTLRRAAGRPPVWIVWENVPGVFSTKDNAFGAFLGGLVGDDAPIKPQRKWTDAGVVSGPERVAAWRVLDAQYFGLAQRRRRVFVLARGGVGAWACADALLPIIDSSSGHPAPRREAGQGVTAILEAGARTGRSTDDVRAGIGISAPGDPMFTLQAGKQHGVHIAPTSPARRTAGGGFGTDFDCDGGLIPHTVGALCDGAHMGGGSTDRTPIQAASLPCVANPLTARMGKGINTTCDEGQTLIPGPIGGVFDGATMAFTTEQTPKWNADQALTLTKGSPTGGGHPQAVAFDTTQITSAANYSNPKPGDPCHPLASTAHPPAVAFTQNQRDEVRSLEIAGALPAEPGMKQTTYLAQHMAVRRLTPKECERLQGFPDNWTDVPYRGKPAADGPRYKALGNSMAVPVMRYLGERIQMVDER